MNEKHVWTIENKHSLSKNIRYIPMKWVFKVKNDNRYRSILVAKVFVQLEGIDYYNSHSPMLTEVEFRCLLLISLNQKKVMVSIDIEKEFLEPVLQETLYTQIPPVLDKIQEVVQNKVCKLNKEIYGLVQASQYFYKEITHFLINTLNFSLPKTEPCLLKHAETYLGLYVDDLIITGPKTQVDMFIKKNQIEIQDERKICG